MVNLKIYKEVHPSDYLSPRRGTTEKGKHRGGGRNEGRARKLKKDVKECCVCVRMRICMCVCPRPHLYVRASVCVLCACETVTRTRRDRYEEQRESCLVV